MEALLEALKRKQSDGSSLDKLSADEGDDSMSMKGMSKGMSKGMGDENDDSSMDDMPMDDESEDEDENSKIVGVLQSDYPNIYAKIAKQVGADDESAEPKEPDPMDMTL